MSNKLAAKMSCNEYYSFCISVRRSLQNKCGLTSTVDGAVGDHNIAKMWGAHFKKLINTSTVTFGKSYVTKMCSSVCYSNDSKSGKALNHHGII